MDTPTSLVLATSSPHEEYSTQFLQGMLNRMGTSYYKYGPIRMAYPDKVDAIVSAVDRIDKYITDGNTESLMDAANFLMIEFMHPRIQGAHFKATDSDGSPGRRTTTGEISHESNKDL